jgi:probable rRNA maturation factor
MKLTITNFQNKTTFNKKNIKQKIVQILHLERKKDANLSVVFVDDKIIKQLNKDFLSKNRPTDVLAFDLSKEKQAKKTLDGEIIISLETAARNSKTFKTSLQYEILLYLAHGILHLGSYNDKSTVDKKRMREREKYILRKII